MPLDIRSERAYTLGYNQETPAERCGAIRGPARCRKSVRWDVWQGLRSAGGGLWLGLLLGHHTMGLVGCFARVGGNRRFTRVIARGLTQAKLGGRLGGIGGMRRPNRMQRQWPCSALRGWLGMGSWSECRSVCSQGHGPHENVIAAPQFGHIRGAY